MGLFGRFRNMSNQVDNYKLFSNWLDKILKQELPNGIVAFNFNLYEGTKGTYDIQLIGSDEFDENDQDWRCTDFYTTGENVCYIKRTKEIEHWEDGLKHIVKLVEQYLTEGNYKNVLTSVTAVGIGFVDGDISIIYHI